MSAKDANGECVYVYITLQQTVVQIHEYVLVRKSLKAFTRNVLSIRIYTVVYV